MVDEIIKRLRQFSTGAGLATIIYLAAQFDIDQSAIESLAQAILALIAFYEIVRDEKPVK